MKTATIFIRKILSATPFIELVGQYKYAAKNLKSHKRMSTKYEFS
jgi:hypothetical protein